MRESLAFSVATAWVLGLLGVGAWLQVQQAKPVASGLTESADATPVFRFSDGFRDFAAERSSIIKRDDPITGDQWGVIKLAGQMPPGAATLCGPPDLTITVMPWCELAACFDGCWWADGLLGGFNGPKSLTVSVDGRKPVQVAATVTDDGCEIRDASVIRLLLSGGTILVKVNMTGDVYEYTLDPEVRSLAQWHILRPLASID